MSKKKQIKIDEEFKDLMPQLSDDEFKQLEKCLKKEGCRDAIVLWGDIIIDGYHRYEICTRNNIPFDTKKIKLKDRDAVKKWIGDNQLGRRNLTPYQRSVIAIKLYEKDIKVKAKDKQRQSKGRGQKKVTSQRSKVKIDTSAELAKKAEVSKGTISKVKKIEDEAPPEIRKKLKEGKISIKEAHEKVTGTKPKPPQEPQEDHQEYFLRKGTVNTYEIKINEEQPSGQILVVNPKELPINKIFYIKWKK